MSKLFLTWNLKPLPVLEGVSPTPYTARIDVEKEASLGVWNSVWNTKTYTTDPYFAEVDSKNHRYRVSVYLEVMGREMRAVSPPYTWEHLSSVATAADNITMSGVLDGSTTYSSVVRVIPNVLRPEFEENMSMAKIYHTSSPYNLIIRLGVMSYDVPFDENVTFTASLQGINNSLGTTITRSNGSSIGN